MEAIAGKATIYALPGAHSLQHLLHWVCLVIVLAQLEVSDDTLILSLREVAEAQEIG